MTLSRPMPPLELREATAAPSFVPAHDLLEWARSTFLVQDGALFNEEHGHLEAAAIGMLWTNVPNARHGKRIVGQAEFKPPGGTMGKWQRGRASYQLNGWFGQPLDFLLTFDAEFAAQADDVTFCSLVEHELFHCGQAKDEFGMPRFQKDSGLPVFAMRGHDIEEFSGIVRRYGAALPDIQEFLKAAEGKPEIGTAAIARACGTCQIRAA